MVENNNKKPDKQPATKPRRSYARVTGLVILWLFVVGLMGACSSEAPPWVTSLISSKTNPSAPGN
ncbi:hypothetical protein CM49_00997 [Paenibacillus sp. P1XP2]|nr:hypothetical protein CM49_00997 [Paenibacillus sp. P1XP2]